MARLSGGGAKTDPEISRPSLIRAPLSDCAAVPREQIRAGVAEGLLTVEIYEIFPNLSASQEPRRVSSKAPTQGAFHLEVPI